MGTHELRFFDPSGTFLTRVGGQGQGPGEFGQLESLHRFPGDSLLAMDWVQSRLSIFTPEGDFVRSALLQPGGPGLPQVIGVLEDGTLVAIIRSLQPQSPRGAGFIREPSLYLAYDSHGMLVDTIGELPDYEVYVQADGSSTSPSSPFNRWAGTAAAGRYFYYGSGSANEVQILTRSGILAGIVRWSAEPRPVGKEDVEEYRRRRLKDVTDPDRRRDMERELARTEHPAFMPAHRSLEVDTEGYLWVESFRPSKQLRPCGTSSIPKARGSVRSKYRRGSRSSTSARTTFWGGGSTSRAWSRFGCIAYTAATNDHSLDTGVYRKCVGPPEGAEPLQITDWVYVYAAFGR